MKYVMIQRGHQVLPVIFPDYLVHEDVANAIISVLTNMDGNKLTPRQAIAAGDVTLGGFKMVSCSGHSETLKLESRGDLDERLIIAGHYTGYME